MGRWSTGAITNRACNRIELSYFLKKGYIKKGIERYMPFSWTDNHGRNTGSIGLYVNWKGERPFLRLVYINTSNRTGEKTELDYKVYLVSVPSNLGKGVVWYFLCPVSGIRCRVLYIAYGSIYFKARKAYQNRIYYSCQMSSKADYANDRYWQIKKRLDKLMDQKYFKWMYKGVQTKRAKLNNRLIQELEYWDRERLMVLDKHLSLMKRHLGDCLYG